MLLVLGGIVGSLVGGYILDKSKAYKYAETAYWFETGMIQYLYLLSEHRKVTIGVYVFSFLSMVLFTSTIHLHEYVALVTMIIVG